LRNLVAQAEDDGHVEKNSCCDSLLSLEVDVTLEPEIGNCGKNTLMKARFEDLDFLQEEGQPAWGDEKGDSRHWEWNHGFAVRYFQELPVFPPSVSSR
jgi:hypothetical protein